MNSAILGICGRRRGGGMATKFQIPTTDCDFQPVDTKLATGNKVVVVGYAYNTTASSEIAGVSIGNNTKVWVCLLWDCSTNTVDWVVDYSNATTSYSYYCPTYNANSIVSDGTDVYSCILANEGGTYKLFGIKINISTGVDSVVVLDASTTTSGNIASVTVMGTYYYCAYVDGSSVKIWRRNKSDLLPVNTVTVTGVRQSSTVTLENDGTNIFLGCTNSTWTRALTLRFTSALASQTTIDSYDSGLTYTENSGFAINGTTNIVGVIGFGGTDWFDYSAVKDGANTNATLSGRVVVENGEIFIRGYTSAGGRGIPATLSNLNSSLVSQWSKDYTADTVSGVASVVYANSKYWLIGFTTGDFDGNNPTNTKRQLIFAQLDISNGDI